MYASYKLVTSSLKAKSVRLSSADERKLCELWELHGITDGDFSSRFRAFILYAHEHASKNHGELPTVQCEKPNCDQFTEVDKGKYECTQERTNKTPSIRKIHLRNCKQCQIQRQKREQDRKEREQKITEATKPLKPSPVLETETKLANTTSHLSPYSSNANFAGKSNTKEEKHIFEFTVVENWKPLYQKSDGSKMCPFSGDLVYSGKECKQCKQTSNAMFTECLQVHWREQKKLLESNLTLKNAPSTTTKNTQKESYL